MLLDYILELSKNGYWITFKENPFFSAGIDIMVQKYDFISKQTIPIDLLNKVNVNKEDMIKTIIEQMVYKFNGGITDHD